MHVTYQDKLNELRLDITHPKSKGKVFVCLEGISDVRFFRGLLNEDNCKVESIPGGKLKVEEAVIELIKIYKLIIGIRDADFLHLENKTPSHPNIFLTDFHDMEMGLVYVDEVFSRILSEHTAYAKDEHKTVRENILKAIRFVGYFRWLNEIEELGIKLADRIDFGSLFDENSFHLDEKDFISMHLIRSPEAKVKDASLILSKINQLMDVNHNLFQLCNGHDFIKVFSIFIKPEQVKLEQLESQFRTTFTVQHYQSTNLYKNTLNWATEQNCKLY